MTEEGRYYTSRTSSIITPWRSIETAPKDGTEFDAWAVWLEYGLGERVPNVKWGSAYIPFESERGEIEGWIAEHWGIDGCLGAMNPEDEKLTHWMPPPDPPIGNINERQAMNDAKDRIIIDAVEHIRETEKWMRQNGFHELADLNAKMANHFEARHAETKQPVA